MDETKIFLLDMNPPSGLGCGLRDLLEANITPSIYLREETMEGCEFDAVLPEFSSIVLQFNPSLIFVALPPNYLTQTRQLIQSLKGKPVIAVFEGFTAQEMMELLRLGVSDFIVPPLKAVDVLPRVWRLLEQGRSSEPFTRLMKEKIGLKQLVGTSPSFVSELEKIPMVARCDANVLISGETGTGKELFARAIHYLSPRAGKPFIPMSCGSIPLELVENELFGHVPGAFTGAGSSQPGLIHEAHGGTLFLDEIDCLPPLGQVKFLRFLQEKEYKQLGSAKVHHADVRVITATNIDLERAVKEGKFRQDLYYRLNVIPISLPPLRERREDIPSLASHFLRKYALEFGKEVKALSPQVHQELLSYHWPGNVRELENVIERSVVFSTGEVIEASNISLPQDAPPAPPVSFRTAKARAIEEFERGYIKEVLLAHHGNISRAAEAVHKNRRAFWELIRKYKIDVHDFKPGSLEKPG